MYGLTKRIKTTITSLSCAALLLVVVVGLIVLQPGVPTTLADVTSGDFVMAPGDADLSEHEYFEKYEDILGNPEVDQEVKDEVREQYFTAQIQVNEYGQTYGSELASDLETGEGTPDLVATRATNGKDGYCYTEELNAIRDLDLGLTKEQLAVVKPMQERRIAQAFCDLAATRYGVSDLNVEVAYAAFEGFDGTDAAVSRACQTIAGGRLSEDQFKELYVAATEPPTIPIPVYESDGRTQIGVYMMSSLYSEEEIEAISRV